MKGKTTKENREAKFLSKSQEVHYQKEFKRADRLYNEISQKRTRS